jgi:hypothetical protein
MKADLAAGTRRMVDDGNHRVLLLIPDLRDRYHRIFFNFKMLTEFEVSHC